MHNRRFGALLVGAWLIGSLVVWFATTQTIRTADHLAASPPPQIQKEFADMGSDAAGNLLRHQAYEVNRRITEAWEILQIGLAGALFVTSLLTPHRSKTSLIASILLCALAAVNAFYLTPAISALGRSLDFMPLGTALGERRAVASMEVWHRVFGILQLIVAFILTGRLLFDFYEFRQSVAPARSGQHRRRRHHRPGTAATDAQVAGLEQPRSPRPGTPDAPQPGAASN